MAGHVQLQLMGAPLGIFLYQAANLAQNTEKDQPNSVRREGGGRRMR